MTGMRRYDAYVFDLYGTLADIHTDEEQPRLWRELAAWYTARGAAWEPEALRRAYRRACEREEARLSGAAAYPEIDIGRVFAVLYEERGVRPSEEQVGKTARAFRRLSTTHLRRYAGAEELLRDLRSIGCKVILLSNAQSLFTRPELEELGLAPLLDAVYISSDCGCRKPDPRFFRCMLAGEGLAPERCLMIGNDPVCDRQGAVQAGLDAWCIRSALSPRGGEGVYDQMRMDLRALRRRLLP